MISTSRMDVASTDRKRSNFGRLSRFILASRSLGFLAFIAATPAAAEIKSFPKAFTRNRCR
jgi:hypothetical protein